MTNTSDSESTVPASTLTASAVIEVSQLLKTYDPDSEHAVRALRGVDLTLYPGSFTAIMGPSGSGKSTLMNILGCLDRPTSGAYFLNAKNVANKTRRELASIRAETLGFVFQSFHLLPQMTSLQNCCLPLFYGKRMSRRQRKERATEALERVGLADKLHRKPTELSGGQQQRVAVARALVNQPKLLLADEPTGNLDSRTGLEILALLQELHSEGLTIVMVTHDSDVAACAQKLVQMRDGCIEKIETNEHPRNAQDALLKMPLRRD